jgi:23S rRNA pseudouridine1911/1915/1917 synthase
MMQIRTFSVSPDDAGERLDRYISDRVDLSRARVKALIKQGHVARDGVKWPEPATRVKPGETYSLEIPPAEPAIPKPQAIELDVVYEDEALIVINKAPNLVVHPAAGNWSGTLVNALLHHCGDTLSGIGGVRRPGIVHRLDKDTSGLMVVAKTDQAHQGLAAQFADHGREGQLERAYLALVWGAPMRRSGKIDAPLDRHKANRLKRAVVKVGGKHAVTKYRILEIYNDEDGKPLVSLARCELETGRTHQIRVHMAHLGHPLLGDALYGSGFASRTNRLHGRARAALARLNRQALHACLLGFAHPVTEEPMRFESRLPKKLARLQEVLRAGYED